MRDVEILETINVRGAHGRIFKIRVHPQQPDADTLAAMKVPNAPDPQFVNEMEIAELLSRYQHPYLLRFLGAGLAEEPFILMELHQEGDLEDAIRMFGPLPLREALDICIQVGEAIHFLHGLGIYHRDIKAENIILSDGGPKVMDFGTAHVYRRQGGIRVLDPKEWAAPRQIDRRRDAVMLGEVLYHGLSGRKIYDARLFALAQRRRLAPAASTRSDAHLYPDAVAQIDTVLRRALNAGRVDHYEGVRYLLSDLRRLREACDRQRTPARAPRVSGEPGTPGTGFLQRAQELAWEATQRESENAAPWIHLGNVHLVAGRAQGAERAYAQALQRDPGNVIARLNDAYASALLGKWDRALRVVLAAANAHPETWAIVRARHIREARHLVVDATELYLQKNPSVPQHRLQLGYAYDAHGLSADAEEEYRQALTLDPGYAPAAEALAFLAVRQGDARRGVLLARQAVRVGEERAESWLALGAAYLASNQANDAAVALSQAVGLDPNHPYCRRGLARAGMLLGELDQAEEDCRRAVRIDPCWAEARLAWGDILAGLGRAGDARSAYRDAITHNPECIDADGRPGLSFALEK